MGRIRRLLKVGSKSDAQALSYQKNNLNNFNYLFLPYLIFFYKVILGRYFNIAFSITFIEELF